MDYDNRTKARRSQAQEAVNFSGGIILIRLYSRKEYATWFRGDMEGRQREHRSSLKACSGMSRMQVFISNAKEFRLNLDLVR